MNIAVPNEPIRRLRGVIAETGFGVLPDLPWNPAPLRSWPGLAARTSSPPAGRPSGPAGERKTRPSRTATPAVTSEPLAILLLEDNPADARLLREALDADGLPHTLRVASDGPTLLALARERPHPDVFLLDLRVPGMDGFEVLEELKKDPRVSGLPVVVFTSSRAEQDEKEAYRRGADLFLPKPLVFDQYPEAIRAIQDLGARGPRPPTEGDP